MITSIASQKGGTGKTTTSISLAAGLARLHNKRVLLVDMDSQANSSKVLLNHYITLTKEETVFATILDKKPLPIHATAIPQLDICPSHILLSETDIKLTTAFDHREARLKKQLDRIEKEYDFVLIDCPPALSWLTLNAFTASHNALVVFSPGYFELDSITQLNRTIGEVQQHFNSSLALLGYLFTMSDPTNNSKVSLELMRRQYADKIFKTVIPRNTAVRDAHFSHTDIFDLDSKATAAQAYAKLIKEVFVHG